MTTTTKQRALTHTQFYQATELAKVHRDGLTKCGTWREARDFLLVKAREANLDLPVSDYSTQEICQVLSIALAGRKRPKYEHARNENRYYLEILARAVANLYEELGKPMTPGLQRIVDIARRGNAGHEQNGKSEQ